MKDRTRKSKLTDRGNWTDEPCYYVSVVDGGRRAILAGPFCHQRQAAAAVDATSLAAEKVNAMSWFYSWGTCKVATGHQDGGLNNRIGFDSLPHKPRQYVRRPKNYGF